MIISKNIYDTTTGNNDDNDSVDNKDSNNNSDNDNIDENRKKRNNHNKIFSFLQKWYLP